MFWDKAYTPSPNIEALLQKEGVKVEEFLDDEDILQECKTQKRNLVQYLTRPDIINRLIELTITEPPEDLPVAQRFKYANVACEVLTIGLPSLDEKLVGDPDILQTLYSFLEQEPPLNPLLSSFFSKTFNMLISKKSEQDWFLYQKMCLQVLEFIKSRGNFLDLIFKHFATPVVMDLLLQMIKEVQGGQLKKNLYEWLTEQQLVERLINILGQSNESEKHNNIAEFLSDLIRNGRSMRQKEQDNDSFEPAFVGSDPLLQVMEEEKTISLLLDVMFKGEVNDSSITAGINIVLTLVDESIVDEPASDTALQMIIDKEKENHEKVVSTVIRVISPRMKEFHDILLRDPINMIFYFPITNGSPSPPYGQTRLEVCRLFTVLLRTGNKDIIKEICETELFNTLITQFKHYNWNNFLHNHVEKCFEYVFASFDQNDNNVDKGFGSNNPSALQVFVIDKCKIISKLIDCWMHNKDLQSSTKGQRLGYMGHLIKIFQYITTCISNSDHIGALIESNLNNDELENWKLITDKTNGELIKELELQNKMLANCDAYETSEYNASLPKEFVNENICSEIFNDIQANLRNCIGSDGGNGNDDDCNDQTTSDKLLELNVMNCFLPSPDEMVLHLERDFKVWDGSLYNSDTEPLNITVNPWGTDPFTTDNPINCNSHDDETAGWADFSNNFADFDAHFNSFTSDLGAGYDSGGGGGGGCGNSTTTTKMNSNHNQNPNSEALNEMKCNNNDEFDEKCGFEDDDDDEFNELSFKNAKNLDMKIENDENITSGNYIRTTNDGGGHGDDDNKNMNAGFKEQMTKTQDIESNLNNDTEDVCEKMKICPNSDEQGDFLQIRNDDTQVVDSSSTNLERTAVDKDKNESESDEEEGNDGEKETKLKQQQQHPVISTSNGPVEHECVVNTDEIQNSNKELIEEKQSMKDENTATVSEEGKQEGEENKKEEKEEENEQSSDTKLPSQNSLNNKDDKNVMIISNDDNLPSDKNLPIIETASTNVSSTADAIVAVNDIPPEKQENGPV